MCTRMASSRNTFTSFTRLDLAFLGKKYILKGQKVMRYRTKKRPRINDGDAARARRSITHI
jgi:hypothetical protein